MALMKLFSKKNVITGILAVAALLVFNIGRDVATSEQQAQFDDWCTLAVPSIEATQAGSAAIADIHVTVSVAGAQRNQWTIPTTSLADAEERSRLVRVLQLLKESQVFGLRGLKEVGPADQVITITVSDKGRSFQTTVPYGTTNRNIQLQNLLTLLEVFASSPVGTQVEPARL
jgi:hypothetical protein